LGWRGTAWGACLFHELEIFDFSGVEFAKEALQAHKRSCDPRSKNSQRDVCGKLRERVDHLKRLDLCGAVPSFMKRNVQDTDARLATRTYLELLDLGEDRARDDGSHRRSSQHCASCGAWWASGVFPIVRLGRELRLDDL
jgi:hypothetical protein